MFFRVKKIDFFYEINDWLREKDKEVGLSEEIDQIIEEAQSNSEIPLLGIYRDHRNPRVTHLS